MKDIVFFEDVFGNFGGIEKVIVNIADRISKEKFHINLLVNKVISDEYREVLKQCNVTIHELQDEFIENPVKRHIRGLRMFDAYLRNRKIAIIHFHISNAIDLLYVLVAKKNGISNRIVHSHNSNATSRFKRYTHNFFKLFLKKTPTVYMACSRKASEWLFGRRISESGSVILLKNAINTKEYLFSEEKRKKERIKYGYGSDFIVGHIGRFNTQKNHMFLIDIFRELRKRKENARLILVGEGGLRKNVENYVRQLGLYDFVEFYGSSNDVPGLLSAFDVFLLPSLYEGLPVVLVETQAASLPALVSDSITEEVRVSEYIKYLSLEQSAGEWAEEILSIADTTRGACYGKILAAGFDIEDIVKQLEEVYRGLS